MNFLRMSAGFLIISVLIGYQARASHYCSQIHDREPITAGAVTQLTNEVQIVWYPNSRYWVLSHLELAVDGTLWAADLNLTREGQLENRRIATRMGGRGFLSFHFKVTQFEFIKLRNDLQEGEGKYRLRTCSGGACHFLARNTGVNIPFPFSISPTLVAVYSTILKAAGSNRIEKIEWVGPKNWREFLTIQPIVELGLAFSGGYAIVVTVIDKLGHPIRMLIPFILH